MQKKHTKIVATISDQRCSQDHIRELFEAGMNVVRCKEDVLAIQSILKEHEGSDRIIVAGGSFGPRKGATFLEISKVSEMLGKS